MAITKIRKLDGIINTAPIVNVHNNAAQDLVVNTWTDVTLDTEVIDAQNNFTGSAFTIPDIGRYIIIATVEINCDDANELFLTV